MNDFNFNDCLYADIKFNYNNYLVCDTDSICCCFLI